MKTSVIINDYLINRKISVIFNDLDFKFVNEVWNNEDKLLKDLQFVELFHGKTRWCDLEPIHYRLMIQRNLERIIDISDDNVSNDNAIIKSLYFLISSLIICIQNKSDSIIELMKINRINEKDVIFDYQATLNIDLIKPKNNNFRIIVNNE